MFTKIQELRIFKPSCGLQTPSFKPAIKTRSNSGIDTNTYNNCLIMIKTTTAAFLLFAGFFLLPAFTAEDSPGLKFPKKVNAIIQNKCYGCHNNESKGDRPKEKLNWDALASLPADQQAEKLAAIQKVLEKGSMPPERFLERSPEKKLTEKETACMQKWASRAAKKAGK